MLPIYLKYLRRIGIAAPGFSTVPKRIPFFTSNSWTINSNGFVLCGFCACSLAKFITGLGAKAATNVKHKIEIINKARIANAILCQIYLNIIIFCWY